MPSEIEDYTFAILTRYADIPVEEKNALMGHLRKDAIGKNEFFVRQGETSGSLALIYKGIFRIYCLDEGGNEKTLAFRRPGQFLAAYSPFIHGQDSWYSIQALTDGVYFYTRIDTYLKFNQRHRCWDTLEKNYITELFMEKENRERSFLLEDATTRYLRFREQYPEFDRVIPQYHIASYLGISPVSLSRIRSKLIQ